MPFVKLDCGMLNSTLWFERLAREIFITALLMAEPFELKEKEKQIEIRSLDQTEWEVPPGRYGFVSAAGVGIIRRAMIPNEEIESALDALAMLGSPEAASRSQEFEGRRLVRIDGGFVVLNYDKYRERDYTAAARQARYRRNKRNAVTPNSNSVTSRPVTQAEAEADKEKSTVATLKRSRPSTIDSVWLKELKSSGAYDYVDLNHEMKKFCVWIQNHKKMATRNRFIAWINRIEKPLKHTPARPIYGRNRLPPPNESLSAEEMQRLRDAAREETESLRKKLNPAL